jgi:peptide chain release factor 1
MADAVARFEAVSLRLADPAVSRDPDQLRKLGQERSDLESVVRLKEELDGLVQELDGAREMVAEVEDAELRKLAESEVDDLERRIRSLGDRARRLLVPRDPLADRPAVLEIRAGTGGTRPGSSQRTSSACIDASPSPAVEVELVDHHRGDPRGGPGSHRHRPGAGGLRHAPLRVRSAPGPAGSRTESQGRIHTSAATVAVLPEAEEVDVVIDPSDLRVDVFRSSGPGGQSVNTTDSAVRITHLPTGLVVTCQDEKSQLKNKTKAMKVLRSRLLDREVAEREAERARDRKSQVGTGDRSAKIRTYNFPQNRVTDHRIHLTLHGLEEILDGDLDGAAGRPATGGRRGGPGGE